MTAVDGRPRVGLVVVSHSAPLASAAIALAAQMAGESPAPVAAAAGAGGGLGTDAAAVATALTEVAARLPADVPDGGILVLVDLGSAVLSAELATELAGDLPVPVRLSPAPLVEGLVAATVLAGSGAGLTEVAAEAATAARAKVDALGEPEPGPLHPPTVTSVDAPDAAAQMAADAAADEVDVVNPHGLHARPAAVLVAAARRFDARVRLTRLAEDGREADARSISAVSALGARERDRVRISASGPDAEAAVAALVALVRAGFGEGTGDAGPRGTALGPSTSGPGVGAEPGPDDADRDARHGPGLPAAPGRAVGPAWHAVADLPSLPDEPPGPPEQEAAALRAALDRAAGAVRAAAAAALARAGATDAAIFTAHEFLLEDEDLLAPAFAAVVGGASAARAWREAAEAAAVRLDALPDPYQRARAADVRDVATRVLRILVGSEGLRSQPGILVATDVTPDDVLHLDPTIVAGVVTAVGSPTSHAAILARSLGLPMVVAAGPGLSTVPAGTPVAMDGATGEVVVDPGPDELARWRAAVAADRQARSRARERAGRPAVTTDGVRVAVEVNARSADDAAKGAVEGAEGVGLVRTEFLFLGRDAAPSEDEQVEAYAAVARAAGGHRVTIRTLDVGGDKPLSYVPQPVEANPFLGLRGLRLSLARPDLFQPQLRAILRVAAEHPVAVMFPMVTTTAEVVAARDALDEAADGLGLPGVPPGLEVGIMVEVPAAALRATHLVRLVDFMSIGTNDLTQYTLAAERGNAAVAALGDALDPAVLRLVGEVCRAAVPSGVRVAVCGELAAEPGAAALLVGLGVRELSVAAPAVAAVKDAVREVSVRDAERLARRALDLPDAAAVRAALG
ncbi:MAG: phosphoenolpyruvate--protein phosphotransferase [Kineosporiaceae bacterium]